jgi:hypothetical protein
VIVKEDLWPAELFLWNEVRGAEASEGAQSEGGAEREVSNGDCRIRAEVICQLATNRDDEKMLGSSMIQLKDKEILGKLDLEACRLQFPLMFENCTIGEINLDQAEAPGLVLINCKMGSLIANQLQTGNIFLKNTTVTGKVGLLDAHLCGVLNLREAQFTGDGVVLNGHNLKVDGDLLAGGLVTKGEVTLTGARIGGYLEFAGAELFNSHGPALRGDGLSVRQDMLSPQLTAHGEVRLNGAEIMGSLYLAEALIENANNDRRRALSADSLTVGRDMDCGAREGSRPFRVDGQLRLPGADIHGRLDLGGAQIANAGGKALFARGLSVGEDLKCNAGFRADGATSLAGAKVGRRLNFEKGTFRGVVNLESATVHRLVDTGASWPDEVILRDFQYHSFSGIDDEESVKDRLQWLNLHKNEGSLQSDKKGYSPQIYNKLAEAYHDGGHDDAAREVLIVKLRARSAARRSILTGVPNAPRRGASWVFDKSLDWTIGYGYRPLNIVWWVFGMLILGALLFGAEAHDFRPKNAANPEAVFHAPLYALDLLLPVAGIGQRGYFLSVEPGLWSATVFILMGWFFGLILLAGLSGVFKRD